MNGETSIIGVLLLGGTIASWQAMGMLGTNLTEIYPHFYFITWFIHNTYILAGVAYIVISIAFLGTRFDDLIAELRRPGYHIFCALSAFLSLMASVAWYYSLPITILSANNAIYQTTPLFVFILSVLFLNEHLTIWKVFSLFICGFGVVLVSFYTQNQVEPDGYIQRSEVRGYLLVLASATMLAIFEVVFDYFSHLSHNFTGGYSSLHSENENSNEDQETGSTPKSDESDEPRVILQIMKSCKFLGILGIYNLIILSPGIILVSLLNVEEFIELPDSVMWRKILQLSLLELVYNCCLFAGIAVRSSVFMAVGQILIIPVGYFCEVLFLEKHFGDHSYQNYAGAFLIIIGFLFMQFPAFLKCTPKQQPG